MNRDLSPENREALSAAITEIEEADGDAGRLWGKLHQMLLKAKIVDAKALLPIIGGRDLDAVRRLVSGDVEAAPSGAADTEHAPPSVDDETVRAAMKAFRKRLKLVRLDHESKLGVGPLTGGKKSKFQAILPPREYPEACWPELVRRGELRDCGNGFYMLASENIPPA